MINNLNNYIYNKDKSEFNYDNCTIDNCTDTTHICGMMEKANPICKSLKKNNTILNKMYNQYNNQIEDHRYEDSLANEDEFNYTHRNHKSTNKWYDVCTLEQCEDEYHPCSMMSDSKDICHKLKTGENADSKPINSNMFNFSESLDGPFNNLQSMKNMLGNKKPYNNLNIRARLNRLLRHNECKIKDVDGNYVKLPEVYPGDDWTYIHLIKDKTYPVDYYKNVKPEILIDKYNEYKMICKSTRKKKSNYQNRTMKKFKSRSLKRKNRVFGKKSKKPF